MLAPGRTNPTQSTSALVVDLTTPEDNDEDDYFLDTQSLTSSITDYPVYWGRRYHRFKQGAYPFPNDTGESERLDIQHGIFTKVLQGRLFCAPLNPETTYSVLDVGTGTGTWAIELADADLLPNATITGTDLSAIQPIEVPENVIFEIQDCTETDWNRPLESIDFIHTRAMTGSFVSYKDFIATARKYLRPGLGWIECHEIHSQPKTDDNSIPEAWRYSQWEQDFYYASTISEPSRPLRIASHLKQWMEDCGFVDVTEHVIKIPIGPWPKNPILKEIGTEWRQNLIGGLPAFSYKLFGADGLGRTRDELELELAAVRKAVQMDEIHSYMRFFVVYGRRPTIEEERQKWGRRFKG